MGKARPRQLRLVLPSSGALLLDTRSTPGLRIAQAEQRAEGGRVVLVLEELTADGVEAAEDIPTFEGEWPDPGPRELPVLRGDPWEHRSEGMRCSTCMWYVPKGHGPQPVGTSGILVPRGRCRRHAPTMSGYPVVFPDDWCGDHKLA